MTCLICHPTDANRIWAGAAGGGVWTSRDGGSSWKSLWHNQESLNVGSLAFDPSDPEVLYCGTGEANLSADSYGGVGLYRSVNGGRTWNLLASTRTTGLPIRIGALAVDPFDPQHLRVGGVGHYYDDTSLGGMYVSRDKGATWQRETFISNRKYWCHAIVFDPVREGTLFSTFTENGIRNGIWRSRDGGETWEHLTSGLPRPERFHRTCVAIAPSDNRVVYALASGSSSRVLGLFRSRDGGDSWQEIHGMSFHYTRNEFEYEAQMKYNCTLAIHPENPEHVICGGIDLHLTRDGGRNWDLVSLWDADRGETNYTHADHHALVMPTAAPGRVYSANDGGVDVSDDGGRNWENRSKDLAATMYYDLDVATTNPDFFGGGTQDNGTLITETGGSDDHFELLGGDGGWMVFNHQDEQRVLASYQSFHLFRFVLNPFSWKDVTPEIEPWERDDNVWMVYIASDPADPRTLFTGSYRLWRSRDEGDNWEPLSRTAIDSGTVSAIEIAVADPRRIYVGTQNGKIIRSTDGGDTWSDNLSGALLPSRVITRIRTSPRNADHVFVTVANFGHSHVFRSLDGGRHWEDIDQGRLPDVPHHGIAIPRHHPDEIYICNDAGVYISPDSGDSWRLLTGKLPRVSVVDLVYHDGEDTLTAATYGRSLWRLKVR